MINNERIPIREQEEVLEIKDKNLIISASAGSGKTTVMIEKILNYILEKNCHTDELLVLTYTKAAAFEMKKKLVDKYKDNLNEYSFLNNELDLVQSSDICTFDSFCQKLVKKYFYILNIDPSFNVLEESEQFFLQNLALKNSIKELQELHPEKYENLLENLSPRRNNELIEQLILQINSYVTSILDPNDFFNKTIKLYSKENSSAEETINSHYNDIIRYYINSFEILKSQCANLCFDSYTQYVSEILIYLEQIYREPKLSKRVGLIKDIPPLKKIKQDEIGLSKIINAEKNKLKKDIFVKFTENFISEQAINDSYTNCKLLIENLIKLYKIFETKYSTIKAKLNSFDFNDIERMTIKLLKNSNIQEQIKSSYKYVFVDEFQDANAIQEEIIFLIENNNLFFVGDTKQSIYAFRQSDPEIFLNIERRFKDDEKSEAKTLNCNFRTNKHILEFANEIFSIIMTENTCGVDYNKNSRFDPKANYEDIDNEVCVSLNLIKENEDNPKKEMSQIYDIIAESNNALTKNPYSKECLFICNKIAELLGEDIYDKELKQKRKISYKDITILIAKRGPFVKTLSKFFIDFNIPHIVDTNDSLEELYDNQVLFNLLKYTINHQDDYSLYCILTSALFNFTDEELARIKLNSKTKKYFYESFEEYNLSDSITEKINKFNTMIDHFAFDCKYKGIYFALSKIIKDSNYLLTISFEEDYSNRKLHIEQYINSFANSKFNHCVADYINYRENALAKEKAATDKPYSEAVQITTMHSSKGLEYPIVILPNLDQDYTREVNSSCIKINKNVGIGIKNFNSDERNISNGIFFEACKIKNKKIEISEKIRLLYVSMTRAKNKLILVGKVKTDFTKYKSDFEIEQTNNYLSMIVNCLDENTIENINLHDEFKQNIFSNEKFELNYVDVETDNLTFTEIDIPNKADEYDTKEVAKFLQKDFSIQKRTIALKNSVSSFAFSDNSSQNFAPKTFAISEHLSEKPNEIGTLYHSLLEKIDFNEINSIADLSIFIECNYNSTNQEIFLKLGHEIIFKNILLLKSLYSKKDTVLKEQKFVMCVPYNEITQSEYNDKLLIQGIIDLIIISENQVILIDYKLTHKNKEQIIDNYKKQIELYEKAISKQFKTKITKYILNLYKSELIEM